MPELELFQAALGLTPPWRVVGSDFDAAAGKLTIDIDFPRGSRFACPTCGRADCPVYDVEPKRWRHLKLLAVRNRAHGALAANHLRALRRAAGGGALGQAGKRLHGVVRGAGPHPGLDMAPSYRLGAARYLAHVPITFDRYHLVQNLNRAMDQVRRAEQEVASTLKKSRYLSLTNPRRLSAGQRRRLAQLRREHRESAEAYRLKLAFEDFYGQPAEVAELYLAEWVEMTLMSGLEAMIDLACSVAEHWDGVLRWFTSKVSNGLLEAISLLVQAAKRRARGYQTTRNLTAIVYLAAGKLNFNSAT